LYFDSPQEKPKSDKFVKVLLKFRFAAALYTVRLFIYEIFMYNI